MKLFLTSTGLENKDVSRHFETSFLPKEPKDLSFLVIAIQDSEQDTLYLEETLNEIRNTGAQDIDVFKLGNEKFATEKEYAVIFVCGGNTFDYLDRLRKTELDKFIIDFAKKDENIYIGVSAGSIIAGPDIEIAGWGSEGDENNIGLKNLKGLELTDFIIFPHYKKELKSELDEFKKKTGHKIIELRDDQAIVLSSPSTFYYINKDL